MEKTDKINIGFNILSLLAAIIAIILSIKAINSSKEIAEKSGDFDRPEMRLDFGNFILPTSFDTIPIVYGINFEKESVNIGALPFQLSNIGKKDGEEIKLLIQYPSKINTALSDEYLKREIPAFTEFKRNLEKNSNNDLVTYSINKINPGLQMRIFEPIVLRNTEISTQVENFSIKATYSFAFTTTILGKDLKPDKKIFSFSCINTSSEEKLIIDYIHNIKRFKDKSISIFFVIPKKENAYKTVEGPLNEYKIDTKDLHCAMIQDLSPKQEMIVALYDMENKLEKIMVFNSKNEYVKTMNISN
jgi:hypothetical protein